MKQLAVVTIVSNNYLHYARTLMQSVARQHPEAHRYVVIVDKDLGPAGELADEFEVLPLSALNLPHGDEFLFQYTVLELNTAVKPWALQALLERGHEQALYIDPDIFLYRPLTDVTDLLGKGASMVLTPHLLAPMDQDGGNPSEVVIRMAGTYNLGFCALRRHPATLPFLAWWQSKLERDCIDDPAHGIFVDQSWMDLVPGMFDDVAILRHPGYNAAYWNLAQRPVARGADGVTIAGRPLHFFHFSGIDPANPQKVSKYTNRFTLATLDPVTRGLFEQYCAAVVANGIERYRALPYGFGKFDDGTPILPAVRASYRERAEVRKLGGPHPFANPRLAREALQDDGARGAARLRALYGYFLRRQPDPSALQHYRHKVATTSGYLRVAAGVALSGEARRHPGWLARVLMWPLARALPAASLPAAEAVPAPESGAPAAKKARAAHDAALSPLSVRAPGINLIGYIAAELGIGEGTRALARSCTAAGVPYSVVDVGYQTSNLQRDTQALAHAKDERFPVDLVYVNADQTPRTVAFLAGKGIDSAYKIGYWAWEQTVFPLAHYAAFPLVNEVWVPSTFVRDAVAPVSPVPVIVIPHAIDFAPSADLSRARFGLPEDKLLCLVMYDFHSYQYRKNPQAAIAAFRRAAAGRDDAVLVVKTINGAHHPDAAAELRASLADLPGVVFIDDYLTRQETWDLQACCDILISLHRAEGFGLAPAEMMFLGKPVVATGWSANMDFMSEQNSMPVRYTLAPLPETIGVYEAGAPWAEADTAHAAECLVRLFDDSALRAAIGARAAADMRARFSPAAVGRLVSERLRLLAYWHPALRG